MSNKQDEIENEVEFENENKSLKEKYLEQTFLTIPIHEIIRLIVLVIACQHLGAISTARYPQLQNLFNKNLFFQILMIFLFCFINTNFKLELSLLATISIVALYVILKFLLKKKAPIS
jgi:hypothetical protein